MNRIRELRKAQKITMKQLAEKLNVAESTVGYWERGEYEPSQDILQKLAVFFNVSVDYLIGRDVSPSERLANVEPIQTKKVPLLGDIAAGKPIFVAEQYGEYAVTSEDVDCDFCLRVRGDSMIGARINDGDIVFIKQQPTVENGEIAAVAIDEHSESEATLKRVYYYPEQGKMILSPENPAFAPLVYVGSELDRVRILGKAVAFQSLVR